MRIPPAALVEPARRACLRSRRLSPQKPRGAALLTFTGEVVAAAEVADLDRTGVGTCAERSVIYRALVAGDSQFEALLVRGGRDGRGDAGPPCGACLQVLYEFAPDSRIYWGTEAQPRGGLTVRQLLPDAFGPEHLQRAAERPGGQGRERETRTGASAPGRAARAPARKVLS